MGWIFLAVTAQFLNAVVAIVDKRIISGEDMLPRPFVYAFYTCLLSGVWLAIYLLGSLPVSPQWLHVPSIAHVYMPTLEIVALSLLAAYTFFIALVSMFTAFKNADAADVVPVVGATSTIVSFFLGYIFLGSEITGNFALGILILVIGTFLVSRFHFTLKTAFLAVHAGIFFGVHYIALKGLFNITPFDNGFFWSRIAFVLFALSLLLVPSYFEKIRNQTKTTTKKAGSLIFANKIIAGISSILILKATAGGDVAVVQALGGLQFVFILLFGIFFTFCPPNNLKCETYYKESILQRALFITVIAVGFLVLFK